MPGIIAFPTVVEEALEEFGGLFANAPERRHFGEYLTGLVVTERKNVSAINAEFADTTDQSCLNRWITQVSWDEKLLNEHRLDWLQDSPSTRYSARGVIAIDNTLVGHSGDKIEDVGWFWDHSDKRHMIAHDYVIANYVCTVGEILSVGIPALSQAPGGRHGHVLQEPYRAVQRAGGLGCFPTDPGRFRL